MIFDDDDLFFTDSNIVPWGPLTDSTQHFHHGTCQTSSETDSPSSSVPSEVKPNNPSSSLEPVLTENMETNTQRPNTGRPGFLDLPLEIRLQIYSWVHLTTPIQQSQLAPWYPTPAYSAYFLQAVVPGLIVPRRSAGPAKMGLVHPSRDGQDYNDNQPGQMLLLSPYRPFCCIPSGLLATCRQVHTEAHRLPFHENEFVFVNWFSSGLTVAHAFVRRLQPWQRAAMRFARLELQRSDLTDEAPLCDWAELCGFWADGLRGLRLRIAVVEGNLRPLARAEAPDVKGLERGIRTPESVCPWIDGGLKKLRALKYLEVELAVGRMDNDEKLRWCDDLSRMLNQSRREGDLTSVLCVERVKEKPRKREMIQGKKMALQGA